MTPHGHIPEEKTGKFGTERLGHFYTEIREITKRNKDGTSRQKIIEEELIEGEQLSLEHQPNKDNPNAVRVSTASGEQIGYLMKGVGSSLITRILKGFRYAAFVDEILEWEPFEGHTHYGVSALVFRVAPRVSDGEICDYVHENFRQEGFPAECRYLKAFGLTPKCEPPAIPPPAPVTVPESHNQPPSPPPYTMLTKPSVQKLGCACFVMWLALMIVAICVS